MEVEQSVAKLVSHPCAAMHYLQRYVQLTGQYAIQLYLLSFYLIYFYPTGICMQWLIKISFVIMQFFGVLHQGASANWQIPPDLAFVGDGCTIKLPITIKK